MRHINGVRLLQVGFRSEVPASFDITNNANHPKQVFAAGLMQRSKVSSLSMVHKLPCSTLSHGQLHRRLLLCLGLKTA
jgi:hypothetical protein